MRKKIFLYCIITICIILLTTHFIFLRYYRPNITGPSSYPRTAKVEIISLTGIDSDGNNNLESIELVLTGSANASPMNLYSLIIVTQHSIPNEIISYSNVRNSRKKYHVNTIKKGEDYKKNYLSKGDILKLNFELADPLYENQTGHFIVKMSFGGTPTRISFTTPPEISQREILEMSEVGL